MVKSSLLGCQEKRFPSPIFAVYGSVGVCTLKKELILDFTSTLLRKLFNIYVTGPRVLKIFKCNICQNHFNEKKSLKKHMKSVHEESKQLYPCDFCGLSYKTKLKMEKHTKTAHDVKMAYQCEICLVGFKHNAKLKKHVKEVHSDKEISDKNGVIHDDIIATSNELESKVFDEILTLS